LLVTGSTSANLCPESDCLIASSKSSLLLAGDSQHIDPIGQFSSSLQDVGLRRSTTRPYLRDAKQFLGWLDEEKIKYFEVRKEDLIRYIQLLHRPEGSTSNKLHERYSPSTIKRKLSAIKRFYNIMVTEGLVKSNPTTNLSSQNFVQDIPSRPPHLLTIEQVRDLLTLPDLSSAKGFRDRALLTLMVLVGLENNEIHKLEIEDFNSSDGRLIVCNRFGRKREVFLPEGIQPALIAWLNVRHLLVNHSKAMFISMHWSSGRGNSGKRLSIRGIYEIVRGYLAEVGVNQDGQCTRILRNTCAALLLDQGATLSEIETLMGSKPRIFLKLERIYNLIEKKG